MKHNSEQIRRYLEPIMQTDGHLEGFRSLPAEECKVYSEVGAYCNLSYSAILERAAVNTPDKVAVIDRTARLTYRDLLTRVKRFAAGLASLGVVKHDRLLLQIANRHEFLVAFHAIQRLGAVPVLAVPRHGPREIAWFLNTTKAKVWIVSDLYKIEDPQAYFENMKKTAPHLEKIVVLGEEIGNSSLITTWEHLLQPAKENMAGLDESHKVDIDPDDVMVLIPTGGTTGMPKIVPRSHNSISAVNAAASKARGLSSDSVMLQGSPVGHAMSMQGAVNTAIYNGATLVLPVDINAKEILRQVEKERVSFILLVPTLLQDIIQMENLDEYDLSSLKLVATAGAPLAPKLAKRAIEVLGKFGCRFAGNTLGASEGLMTSAKMNDSDEIKMHTVGRNIVPGSHYKIVDSLGEECGQGDAGELVVKGPEVFTGYYGVDADESQMIFTADGYYKTGDIARKLANGYIEITGRAKDIIQRGGESIIPSEMENILINHPKVEAVAVVAMPCERLGERACACVVPRDNVEFTFEEMIDFMKQKGAGVLLLPERLEIYQRLPLTKIGKVDKSKIKQEIEGKLDGEKTVTV